MTNTSKAPTQEEITQAMESLGKPDWYPEFCASEIVIQKTKSFVVDLLTHDPAIVTAANIASAFVAGFLTGYNRALKEVQCQKTTIN